MKIYLTVNITKGWDTWNEMAEELNPEYGISRWNEIYFQGLLNGRKKIHLIKLKIWTP